MSFPSPSARSPRLSGRATRLILVALSAVVIGSSPTGASAAGSTALAALTTATEPARWLWPLIPPHEVVRDFVAPATTYSAGHRGIDIAATVGDVVTAPTEGIVHFAGTVVDRPLISIEHPGGIISSYEPVASTLVSGDPVPRGSPIGVVEAGHCAATCLHMGVRLRGDYVTPLLFLGDVQPSVLLPTRPIG